MYLYKEHMRPVEEIIEEAREEAKKVWESEEFINRYIYQNLSYIIRDFQQYVNTVQDAVKPR